MTNKEAIKILEKNKPSIMFEDEETQKRMADIRDALEMAIQALSQEELGKWIDVNERLPEGLLVKVLVSCEDSLGLPIVPKVVIYDGYEHSWECDEKVIAWMPLPKPYEPQESEE